MQTEAEMRLHRCCFTGHRPEKLRRSELEIRLELENEIPKNSWIFLNMLKAC
jgi:hypothetical protein